MNKEIAKNYENFYLENIEFTLTDGKTNFEKKKINKGDLFTYIYVKQKLELVEDIYEFEKNSIDGSGDGGIDFVISDEQKGYFFQSKSGACDFKELKECASKMKTTINEVFSEQYQDYKQEISNEKKKFIIKEMENINNFELYIIVANVKLNPQAKENINKIEQFLNQHEKPYATNKKFNFNIIETQNDDFFVNDYFVNVEGKLTIDEEWEFSISNPCYKTELNLYGVLTSVKIIEVYNLYKKHHDSLFRYNVRNFIGSDTKQSRTVNKEIETTLEQNPELFWFMNNGVFLVCKNMTLTNNILKVSNFSVINGAQTITKIFNFIEEKIQNKDKEENVDIIKKILGSELIFKIVKIDKKTTNFITQNIDSKFINEEDFMMDLVKSSNQQKPVVNWTFFYNDKNVKEIENKIRITNKKQKQNFKLQTKDGTIDSNFKKSDVLKLDHFCQLAYAIFSLKPGKAIQNKTKLFDSNEKSVDKKPKFKEIITYPSTFQHPNLVFEINNFFETSRNKKEWKDKKNEITLAKMWILSGISILYYLHGLGKQEKEKANEKIKKFITDYENKDDDTLKNEFYGIFSNDRSYSQNCLGNENLVKKIDEMILKNLVTYINRNDWTSKKNFYIDKDFYKFIAEYFTNEQK